jgi:hypothetical protein
MSILHNEKKTYSFKPLLDAVIHPKPNETDSSRLNAFVSAAMHAVIGLLYKQATSLVGNEKDQLKSKYCAL